MGTDRNHGVEQLRQAGRLYREGRYAESLELLEQLDARYPNTLSILYSKASALGKLGRYDEALTLCDRLVAEFDLPKAEALKQKLLSRRDAALQPSETVPIDDQEEDDPSLDYWPAGAFDPKLKPVLDDPVFKTAGTTSTPPDRNYGPRPALRPIIPIAGAVVVLLVVVIGLGAAMTMRFWLKRAPVDKAPNAVVTEPGEAVADAGVDPADVTAATIARGTSASPPEQVSLEGVYSQAVLAHGGDYILFVFPKLKKVCVFDVAKAKAIGSVDTSGENVFVAGGADSFFVVDDDTKTIGRYSLSDFNLQDTGHLPITEPIISVSMGYSSTGPMVIQHGVKSHGNPYRYSQVRLPDLNTLKPIKANHPTQYNSTTCSPVFAANGSCCAIGASGSNELVCFSDDESHTIYTSVQQGYVAPDPAGRYLYTGVTVCSNRFVDVFPYAPAEAVLPTTSPGYYLKLKQLEPTGTIREGNLAAALFLAGGSVPLLVFPILDECSPDEHAPGHNVTYWQQRIFYVVQHGRLVTLPKGNDSVMIRHIPIRESLDAFGEPYLYVTSIPETVVVPGTTYGYRLETLSSSRDLRFSIVSGTAAMSITADGVFAWEVPPAQAVAQAVIIAVEDGAGTKVHHAFSLYPETPAKLAAASPAPPQPGMGQGDLNQFSQGPAPQPTLDPRVCSYPPASPIDIKEPPGLTTEMTTRMLPARTWDCSLAGWGRYLLFVIPETRGLAVFDVNRGEVVDTLPLPADCSMVTGGADYFFVLDPIHRIISRYNLATRKLEATQALLIPGPVQDMKMGYASNGPLVIRWINERKEGVPPNQVYEEVQYALLDVNTLAYYQPVSIETSPLLNAPITVCADGTMFTVGGDSGFYVVDLVDGQIRTGECANSNNFGYIVPDWFGDYLYTARDIFDWELKANPGFQPPPDVHLPTNPNRPRPGPQSPAELPIPDNIRFAPTTYKSSVLRHFPDRKELACIPSTSPDYYVSLPGEYSTGPRKSAAIYRIDTPEPVVQLPDLEEYPGETSQSLHGTDWYWRLIYVPQANLLITLPETDDRVILRRVELSKSPV